MRAVILAAGIGWRLGGGDGQPPKSLIRFEGQSLLERNLRILAECGIGEVAIGVGYRADVMQAEIARLTPGIRVTTVYNPDFREGNIVTLWTLREHLVRGGDCLLMDADVLYDRRMIDRLVESAHPNCFLLDRDFEPGDEPVKLCVRDGRLVEFRKQIDPSVEFDLQGESVGFFRLSHSMARRLVARAGEHIARGCREEFYEEALRDLLLADAGSFGFEDVTGLPWIEIDFPDDVRRAREEVFPRLVAYEARIRVA